MLLPIAIQVGLLTDLALKISAALMAIDHGILVAAPIAETGVVITSAVVLHESGRMLHEAVDLLLRRRRTRK